MAMPLLVVREGIVRGANDAAVELFGPCVGGPCAQVKARGSDGPVCTATCSLTVTCADRPRVRIRGAWWRLVCSRVGEQVVVQLLPPEAGAADGLTPRERETMAWVSKGLTTREIAARLGISTGTVRTHVERVLTKLGARSRAEAIARIGGAREPEGG